MEEPLLPSPIGAIAPYSAYNSITTGPSDRNPSHSAPSNAPPISKEAETPCTCLPSDEHIEVPYIVGAIIKAVKHVPTGPYGARYTTRAPKINNDWKSLSQTALCTTRAPLAGSVIPDVRMTLNITATIRTGIARGAQLVVVNDSMVAKFFDPLFYDYHYELSGRKRHVISFADVDYACEAAAFDCLQHSAAARTVTPEFFGTWIANIKTRCLCGSEMHDPLRQVPFIIMEHIKGKVMLDIDTTVLDQTQRNHIMKKALKAEAELYHAGLHHDDYWPRNIVITNFDYSTKFNGPDDVDVKVVDFNVSTVMRHPDSKMRDKLSETDELEKAWAPKLLSPICRWYGQMMGFMGTWISGTDGEAEQWLWQQFHDDEQFIPVISDTKNRRIWPQHMQAPALPASQTR